MRTCARRRKAEEFDDIASVFELAENGDAKAQYQLGAAYDEGKGVEQNWVQASTWFYLSARSGYAKAKRRWKELKEEILSPDEVSLVMEAVVDRGSAMTAEEVKTSMRGRYEPGGESLPSSRRSAPASAPPNTRAKKETTPGPERNPANQSGGFRPSTGQNTGDGPDLSSIFGDIFEDFFAGGGARRARDSAGARRLILDLSLSFEEAALGCSRRIRVTLPERCGACGGDGAEPGSRPVRCPQCEGRGHLRVQRGFFSAMQTCPRCGGRGEAVEKPCRTCGGRGETERPRSVSLNIPAGVDDGDSLRIRLDGAGEGEALLRIHVESQAEKTASASPTAKGEK